MKKPSALASALRNSGAAVAASSIEQPPTPALPQSATAAVSRLNTKAITVHFPDEVRRQLKTIAAEEGRSMEDMVAEALNMLFVRYRRPELAPRKFSI